MKKFNYVALISVLIVILATTGCVNSADKKKEKKTNTKTVTSSQPVKKVSIEDKLNRIDGDYTYNDVVALLGQPTNVSAGQLNAIKTYGGGIAEWGDYRLQFKDGYIYMIMSKSGKQWCSISYGNGQYSQKSHMKTFN